MARNTSMGKPNQQRLRLKLPDGSEFEAEGTAEFVQSERQQFQASINPPPTNNIRAQSKSPEENPYALNIHWETIIEQKDGGIHLRAKLSGDRSHKDACMVLLSASQSLLRQPRPTATQLAKWLRISGYPVQRMDRTLQEGIAQREILSSGSRRARRYELTGPGKIKALLLAQQLASTVTGQKPKPL